jgi:hypothetical protein
MRVSNAELRQAMQDPGRLPPGELPESGEYATGSDEAFLRRLWRDLYGNEPSAPPDTQRPAGTARCLHARPAAARERHGGNRTPA